MSVSGVHAPNREKVAFGLKRKAEAVPGTETDESVTKKTRSWGIDWHFDCFFILENY